MNIDKEVIKSLNKVIAINLIAINQYFLHARILKHQGLDKANSKIYKQSIIVMKETDDLVSRVLLLEGIPNLQNLGKLLIGENVTEILSLDLQLEKKKHQILLDSMLVCEHYKDFISKDLLLKHKYENEDYIDWLDTQIGLIEQMGKKNFIQNLV